jgi:hypothetical protein
VSRIPDSGGTSRSIFGRGTAADGLAKPVGQISSPLFCWESKGMICVQLGYPNQLTGATGTATDRLSEPIASRMKYEKIHNCGGLALK